MSDSHSLMLLVAAALAAFALGWLNAEQSIDRAIERPVPNHYDTDRACAEDSWCWDALMQGNHRGQYVPR